MIQNGCEFLPTGECRVPEKGEWFRNYNGNIRPASNAMWRPWDIYRFVASHKEKAPANED